MFCQNFSSFLFQIRSSLFALPVSKAKVISFIFYFYLFFFSENKSSAPLELIFSDVWGPSPILYNNGARFYVIFVDHFSKFTWLYPIACKSDVFTIFSKFQAYVERQFNHKIKSIQTDGGGEFTKLRHHFASHGIHHRITCAHTHQQNGSVKRKHRHIVEMGLTLLAHCSAPIQY